MVTTGRNILKNKVKNEKVGVGFVMFCGLQNQQDDKLRPVKWRATGVDKKSRTAQIFF